jgi:hypothetical protein
MPIAILAVICSPNTSIPMNMAVSGSNAPSTAVDEGPINFIDTVSVSRESIVGINANAIG